MKHLQITYPSSSIGTDVLCYKG